MTSLCRSAASVIVTSLSCDATVSVRHVNDRDVINTNKSCHSLRQVLVFDEQKFNVADANHDGFLSEDEFYDFVHPQNTKTLSDIEINKIMLEYDNDSDGKITKEEYKLFMGDDEEHGKYWPVSRILELA